jgi:hypothetical protein
MGFFVYALCALTSLMCFVLLMRQYRRTRSGLLLSSAFGFLCFTIANVLLFVDLIVFAEKVDLRIWRNSVNLVGVIILLLGVLSAGEREVR